MTQFSTIVNPYQPETLPSNTIQNQKNDRHWVAVSIQRGKKTIDTPMQSGFDVEFS